MFKVEILPSQSLEFEESFVYLVLSFCFIMNKALPHELCTSVSTNLANHPNISQQSYLSLQLPSFHFTSGKRSYSDPNLADHLSVAGDGSSIAAHHPLQDADHVQQQDLHPGSFCLWEVYQRKHSILGLVQAWCPPKKLAVFLLIMAIVGYYPL